MIEKYDSFDELYAKLRGKVPAVKQKESSSWEKESGIMKYKLNEVVTSPTSFYLPRTAENGRRRWGSVRLDPGKIYETDDPLLIESISAKGIVKVPYNPRLEEKLKELGKEYEVELCKSCGGRVKKIKYRAVEILQ